LLDLSTFSDLDAVARERLLRLVEVARSRNFDCSALERRLERTADVDLFVISDSRAIRAVARARAACDASDKLIADSKALVVGSMLRVRHHRARGEAV
jgi:hypothetical protein